MSATYPQYQPGQHIQLTDGAHVEVVAQRGLTPWIHHPEANQATTCRADTVEPPTPDDRISTASQNDVLDSDTAVTSIPATPVIPARPAVPATPAALASPAIPGTLAMPAIPALPESYPVEKEIRVRVIAIANQKGGAGKTTTAVNLAAALGEAGARVLLVDLDPQRSATRWLAATPIDHGLSGVLERGAGLAELITVTAWPGVELVAGDAYLAGAERLLATTPVPQVRLRTALQTVDGYDLVLIDCPPALGILAVNALAAASDVLIPVAAQAMELDGLADLENTMDAIRDGLEHHLQILGVLACRMRTTTRLAHDVFDQLRATHDQGVFDTPIRENVRIAEAYAWQEPVTSYAPESHGAVDHRAAAAELAGRIVS